MPSNFYNRLDRKTKIDEAKRRFVARVSHEIFPDLFSMSLPSFKRAFAAVLEKRYHPGMSLEEYIDPGFEGTLQALEAFSSAYSMRFPADMQGLDALHLQIRSLLEESEVDLGVRWNHGQFVQSRAIFLDETLVDDVFRWLQEKNYENVLEPYRRGLAYFLQAENHPEMLADVVTEIYTSFEELVKNITNTDLSTNKELFINTIKVSYQYKNLLREYIKYANECNNAVQLGENHHSLSLYEVESFIYLTGIFIRLAMTTVR